MVLPSDRAHIRSAMVAGLVPLRWPRRFFVLLLSSCGGQSRSQLAKCFSVGKRLTSTPISAKITRAVPTSIPSIKVRSTPKARNNGPVASNRTSLLLRLRFRGLTVRVFAPARLGKFASSAWTCWSHSVICR